MPGPELYQGWGGSYRQFLSYLDTLSRRCNLFPLGGTAAGTSEVRDPITGKTADARRHRSGVANNNLLRPLDRLAPDAYQRSIRAWNWLLVAVNGVLGCLHSSNKGESVNTSIMGPSSRTRSI